MVRYDVGCGRPLAVGDRFCLAGQTYRLLAGDERLLAVLAELAVVRHFATGPWWLWRYRDAFRDIVAAASPTTLVYIALVTRDDGVRRLAIWLRGRMRTGTALDSLAVLARSRSELVRRELVRALRRLQAWNWLRRIAQYDPSPRVRAFAARRSLRTPLGPLARRLRSFARLPTAPTRPSLYVHRDVELRLRPPKPADLLRRLLQRIHDLVRGTAGTLRSGKR